MLDKKAVLSKEKIKAISLTKSFLNYLTDFFIINSNIQELIRHIHCSEYVFCHKNKAMKFW